MAWSVILLYVFLVIWMFSLLFARKTGRWLPTILMGIAGVIVLNSRYVLGGVDEGIRFFVSIADPFVNFGSDGASAVTATCPANDNCSYWGEAYTNHASWTIAFRERFVGGPEWRNTLLLGHIIFNTIALILATLQIFRPGNRFKSHKAIGVVVLVSVSISLFCAGWLTSELRGVAAYGGIWGEFGLYFLSFCVLTPAFMGIAAAAKGNHRAHRIWMWRFVGAIWGSYWIFRLEAMLIDLLVRDIEGLPLAVPAWTSGVIGIVIGELIRRHLDQRNKSSIGQLQNA